MDEALCQALGDEIGSATQPDVSAFAVFEPLEKFFRVSVCKLDVFCVFLGFVGENIGFLVFVGPKIWREFLGDLFIGVATHEDGVDGFVKLEIAFLGFVLLGFGGLGIQPVHTAMGVGQVAI